MVKCCFIIAIVPLSLEFLPNFSKSSFKIDLSIVLGMGQNFQSLHKRETSALLDLRRENLKTLPDTKYPFILSFTNSAI